MRVIEKKPRVWVAACLAAVLASSLAPLPVFAAPSAADVESARSLMAEGRAERAKGNHKAALQHFAAAHKIMNVPTTGVELGLSQAELGMLVEARETWIAVTKMPVDPKEPAPFAAARERAAQLAEEINPRIPTVRFLFVNTKELNGLDANIDGISVDAGVLLVPRRFNPGAHSAVFKLGGRVGKVKFQLAESESRELEIEFFDEAASAPTKTVTAPPPRTDPKPSPLRAPLVFGGFGLAAMSLVVGGVAGGLSLSRGSAAKENCVGNACPESARNDLDSARSWATISNIGFAVAGVSAVVGVVGLFLPTKTSTTKDSASTGVLVGVGSVSLVGSF